MSIEMKRTTSGPHLRITEKMKWNDWNESWKLDPDSLIRKLKDETGYRQAQEQLKAVTSRIELEQKRTGSCPCPLRKLCSLSFANGKAMKRSSLKGKIVWEKTETVALHQARGIRHQQHSNATERKKAENFLLDSIGFIRI